MYRLRDMVARPANDMRMDQELLEEQAEVRVILHSKQNTKGRMGKGESKHT